MTPVTLSYVIPVYNEDPIIESTLEQFVRELADLADIVRDYEILVIDDGSTDRTAELVESFSSRHPKVRLIRHGKNRGVGQAIRTGLSQARMEWFSVNCADQPFRTADIRRLEPLFGKNDLVVVCRLDRSANSFYRKLTSLGNYALIRLLFRSSIHDFQFAQFYRMSYLSRVNLICRGTLVPPEMILRCLRLGARMSEFWLPFHPRMGGESKFGHPKHFVMTLREMARLRIRLWKEEKTA
ncbi:MAG TPA: glycosyltransferase family 2 protein [bacterium]|nr:glycosyltransferase family 2 protein [bacterium]